MSRIVTIIFASLWIVGCGPDGLESDVLNDFSYADNVKIAIGEANPGAADEYKVAVAFNGVMAGVKICAWNGTNCVIGSELPATVKTTVGTRTIFETASHLRIDTTTIYAVSYASTAGAAPSTFKFKFAVAGSAQTQEPTPEASGWKALFVTGDNEFNAWDNARRKLVEMFQARGVKAENIRQLSMAPAQQTGGVGQTSKANIQASLKELTGGTTTATGENCLVFMTSHGTQQGFFLRNQGTLSRAEFGQYLDATCGDRPTVAIISACYSGVMIGPETQKPNRIILTAASRDKTSFGCDARSTYTFFDECVIQTLPKAQNWKSFAELNTNCVKEMERAKGMPHFSNPQAFFGANVQNLAMPNQ